MIRSARTIILLLFMLGSLLASGQSYIGVFGGLNRSKLSGDSPAKAKYKNKLGANIGANIDIKLSNIIWLSIQPSYSQEGTRLSYSLRGNLEPVDSVHIRLNYFSAPLLLKISSTNGRFYALGGIEAGYLLSHAVSSHGNDLDADLNIADWNFTIHFGAGIYIPIGFPRLFIELRYSQGLTDLTDESQEISYIPRIKTSGFKLLAGIEIPLKRNDK